jgi:hypothetical protein
MGLVSDQLRRRLDAARLGGARHGAWPALALLLGGAPRLASASALGLMLSLLGILQPAHATLSLWYVLILAGGVGTACALAPGASLSAS